MATASDQQPTGLQAGGSEDYAVLIVAKEAEVKKLMDKRKNLGRSDARLDWTRKRMVTDKIMTYEEAIEDAKQENQKELQAAEAELQKLRTEAKNTVLLNSIKKDTTLLPAIKEQTDKIDSMAQDMATMKDIMTGQADIPLEESTIPDGLRQIRHMKSFATSKKEILREAQRKGIAHTVKEALENYEEDHAEENELKERIAKLKSDLTPLRKDVAKLKVQCQLLAFKGADDLVASVKQKIESLTQTIDQKKGDLTQAQKDLEKVQSGLAARRLDPQLQELATECRSRLKTAQNKLDAATKACKDAAEEIKGAKTNLAAKKKELKTTAKDTDQHKKLKDEIEELTKKCDEHKRTKLEQLETKLSTEPIVRSLKEALAGILQRKCTTWLQAFGEPAPAPRGQGSDLDDAVTAPGRKESDDKDDDATSSTEQGKEEDFGEDDEEDDEDLQELEPQEEQAEESAAAAASPSKGKKRRVAAKGQKASKRKRRAPGAKASASSNQGTLI